ncbi:hypothetical protein GCM10007415_12700 [Parapedobacter pyrenivorans]|uniref:Heparan-alpha-glucosaminide N-acetyltransferase catalytic domain-containing protein n=2 Tax=Parapedobacter pyrenivorans TaxID=1305674 RepID=A0A917M6R6_9SPHI|nr:hypothetical protein GCM10007415_12700 [Parapedobacter pyrenivorans]
MALDHIRDLFHESALLEDPTNLATTTPALFFTRWITHLCAPIFVFLSGTSVYLSFRRPADTSTTRKLLITRGLWLILLEFTVVNFGIWFDIHFEVFLAQVIAAIGLGLILLGILLGTPPPILGLIGVFIISTYSFFPLSQLVNPGLIPLPWGSNLLVGYPPIPWIAILLVGYWAGTLMELDKAKRSRTFLLIGVGCLVSFILVRLVNGYGDPAAWGIQKNDLYTFLSFINVTKYPPSLLFDLLMLGSMFLLLSLAERLSGRVFGIVKLYGSVPLFYYLLHWYIIHLLLFLVLFFQGFTVADFRFGFNFGRPEAPSGLPLWGVYAVWVGVVALLYPLCRWYSRYKSTHKEKKWLRYL